MSFLGLFTFTAPYLPWVLLGFSFLLGNDGEQSRAQQTLRAALLSRATDIHSRGVSGHWRPTARASRHFRPLTVWAALHCVPVLCVALL